MSFFSNGFGRMNKFGKKTTKNDGDKRERGEWQMLTDAYGRTYWQHTVTGEWSYPYGGGLVSPISTVIPSPIGYPGTMFTPSPVPTVFTPSPAFVIAPPVKGKKEKKEQGKGFWDEEYDKDGGRFWRHTATKKTTYSDPYY